MSEKESGDHKIEGHEYDGISELDNPLPKWWLLTFYGAIVFSIFYFGYYVLGSGPSSDEELALEMKPILAKREQSQSQSQASAGDVPESQVNDIRDNPEAMAEAKKIFLQFCAACHGNEGQGVIGPNLTDNHWIHSKGDAGSILIAIREGFPTKGMPPWGNIVPKEQHLPLAVYVTTLIGSDPPNPKAPQGDLVQ